MNPPNLPPLVSPSPMAGYAMALSIAAFAGSLISVPIWIWAQMIDSKTLVRICGAGILMLSLAAIGFAFAAAAKKERRVRLAVFAGLLALVGIYVGLRFVSAEFHRMTL